MFSEVSVYGHLALSLWAYGEAEYHGRECMVENYCGQEVRKTESARVSIPPCRCPFLLLSFITMRFIC
jgi:hypothetical protein